MTWHELTSGPERYDDGVAEDPMVGWQRRFRAERPDGTWLYTDPVWYIQERILDEPPRIVLQACLLWCRDPERPDKTALADPDKTVWYRDYSDIPATDEHTRQAAAEFDPADFPWPPVP